MAPQSNSVEPLLPLSKSLFSLCRFSSFCPLDEIFKKKNSRFTADKAARVLLRLSVQVGKDPLKAAPLRTQRCCCRCLRPSHFISIPRTHEVKALWLLKKQFSVPLPPSLISRCGASTHLLRCQSEGFAPVVPQKRLNLMHSNRPRFSFLVRLSSCAGDEKEGHANLEI